MLLLLLACHTPPRDDQFVWDPLVQRGELPNGLDWYVEPGGRPANRAELRLVVKVGSGVERDDERGYAHLVEHLAFNGTTHFPKDDLVHFIESSGMRFGADLNASTSVESTIYKLQIATDDPAQLDRALTWFADIASGITFDPAEVRSERGVVHEEWRGSLGFRARMADAVFPVLWGGTTWANRLPIGTESSITGVEAEPLQAFWSRWYRPELMAVVVAGTVKPADVQAAIEKAFAGVPARTGAAAVVPMPALGAEAQVVALDEPEAPGVILSLSSRAPYTESWSVAAARSRLVEELAMGVLNERLGDRARDPAGPLLGASGQAGRGQPGVKTWSVNGGAKPGKLEAATVVILDEVERLRRHGVTPSELERARAQRTASAIAYRDGALTETSSSRVSELIRHVVYGESVPGTAQEAAAMLSMLPAITEAEVDAAAAATFPPTGRILFAVHPTTDPAPLPKVEALEAELLRVRTVDAPVDVVAQPLVATPPTPGKVVAERTVEALVVTEWTLSNGARVVVKPTAFVNDEVKFSMRSLGGYAGVADAELPSAKLADSIAASSGMGALDPDAVSKTLAGKRAGVSVNLGSVSETMTGSSNPADIETMLQIAWLRVVQPRFTEDGLRRVLEKEQANVAGRFNSPETLAGDRLDELLWSGSPRRGPWTLEKLAAVRLDTAATVYKQRLADAGDFTFVFVGDLDLATLKPLVERWLGSMPGTPGTKEPWADDHVRYRTGPAEETIHSGKENKATVTTVYFAEAPWSLESANRVSGLKDALSRRLREVIREGEGGTYGVKVTGGSYRFFPSVSVRISFSCDPARVAELTKVMDGVIDELRAKGVGDDVAADLRAQMLKAREVAMRDNGSWLDWLGDIWVEGAPEALITGYEARVATLDGAAIQAAATLWLDPQHRVRVTRLPE